MQELINYGKKFHDILEAIEYRSALLEGYFMIRI